MIGVAVVVRSGELASAGPDQATWDAGQATHDGMGKEHDGDQPTAGLPGCPGVAPRTEKLRCRYTLPAGHGAPVPWLWVRTLRR